MLERPNILLILADDMGYGDLDAGLEGGPALPVLHALRSDGLCLTQHYSGSPVCAPARAALLTGRYPHRTGVVDTLETLGLDRLHPDEVTLAARLEAAGYATGLVGKWHLGAFDPRFHPRERGFAEFVGFRGGWMDYYRWRLEAGGRPVAADGRYLTDVFTEAAVDFLGRHRHEPFFLHLAYNAPHFPLQAPEQDVARFRAPGRTEALATLYAMLRVMDRGVGRVLETLDRLGLRENTLVLFASDNGPDPGGAGEASTLRPNAGWRGHKCQVFEGGIRVPALLRWPAGLPGGGRALGDMVHFCDWMPTLLEAAGVAASGTGPALDGASILGLLRGGDTRRADQTRFWQWNRYHPHVTSNAAMRVGDWKLVRPEIAATMRLRPEDVAADRRVKEDPEWRPAFPVRIPLMESPPPPPPLLFNLAEDPGETRDLLSVEPRRAAAMLGALEGWFEEVTGGGVGPAR